MSKREKLIEAAEKILWEEGYEAMSPKKVMRASGAGQGSLYHHFDGKEDLASTALEKVADDMCEHMDQVFSEEKAAITRLEDYLMADRAEMQGCKLGRLVQEKSCSEAAFAPHIRRYFSHVTGHLEKAIAGAQQGGDLPPHIDPLSSARTLMAVIQGGYVLARSSGDPSHMAEAQSGAWAFIEAMITP